MYLSVTQLYSSLYNNKSYIIIILIINEVRSVNWSKIASVLNSMPKRLVYSFSIIKWESSHWLWSSKLFPTILENNDSSYVHVYHLGNSNGFRSCVPGTLDEDQNVFFIWNHNLNKLFIFSAPYGFYFHHYLYNNEQ